MQELSIAVRADWDEEAEVWVATSEEIDGLAVEAATVEELRKKVSDAVCDLIEENGLNGKPASFAGVPVHIMASQMVRTPETCH